MQQQFLCDHHRRFFNSNPCMARRYSEQCIKEGAFFITHCDYQTALTHMGSGFDIMVMLIEMRKNADCDGSSAPDSARSSNHSALQDMRRLLEIADAMGNCYRELGKTDKERFFLLNAHFLLLEMDEQDIQEDEALHSRLLAESFARLAAIKNHTSTMGGRGLSYNDCDNTKPAEKTLNAAVMSWLQPTAWMH